MTVDQLQQRDRRIRDLEDLGRARTTAQQDELGALIAARDSHWRRLPTMIAAARAKAERLDAYARQAGFRFEVDRASV